MAYEPKTTKTDSSVDEYLSQIADERKRADARALVELMREVTGEEPALWGSSIVGFGSYRYRYASGHSGESLRVGFAPRAASMTLYLSDGSLGYGDEPEVKDILDRLGKHKTGKACLYIKRLSDVDTSVLKELIGRSWNAGGMGEVRDA